MSRVPIRVLVLALFVLAFGAAMPASAEEVSVPIGLQVDLLVKVAAYDRNLPPRAGDRVRLAILTKPGNAESERAAAQMEKALGAKQAIANLPHEETIQPFSDSAALVKLCRSKRLSIVYLAPGFSDEEIASMAKALDGVDVLTASTVASFVPKGIVLGFDLVSGKPKLLVHLGQAKRQKVDLSAEILKLMRVYE